MQEQQSSVISEEEIAKQKEYISYVRNLIGSGKYMIHTYGCQMNVHDSELLSGMLEEMGYTLTEEEEEADIILFNTCCVRDNAERRVSGNIGALSALKRKRPNLILGVCGCMMQQEGAADRLLQLRPYIDLIFGTHNLYSFPQLLYNALVSGNRVMEIDFTTAGQIAEHLPLKRSSAIQGYLTIMYGCNNYCSYCIVPYVRGRERSRTIRDIVSEAEEMAASGIKEIMLLGQNVNSFGLNSPDGESFPDLLHALDGVVPRIRFMTSHPKDLSDSLIEEMSSSSSVCPQFHLPVQSGSDRILSVMNRHYTREKYMDRVKTLRKYIPNIGLSSDFIVGFPGETEEDFEDTLSLVETVRYDSAYTFIYSPRKGTPAAAMENQIDEKIKHERLSRLIFLQEKITKEQLDRCIGNTESVLVEGASKRQANFLSGRTGRGMMVNFAGGSENIGKILSVRIVGAGTNTLRGELMN